MKFLMTFEIGDGADLDLVKTVISEIGCYEFKLQDGEVEVQMKASLMWCNIEAASKKTKILAEKMPAEKDFKVALRVIFHRHGARRQESANEILCFAREVARRSPAWFVLSRDFEDVQIIRDEKGLHVLDTGWEG